MIIFLLDRDVSIAIREHVKALKTSPGASAPDVGVGNSPHLLAARDVDRKAHLVSPLLSIIEGAVGTTPTAQDILAALQEEVDAIAQFFTSARTDSKFLKQEALQLATTFAQDVARETSQYLNGATELRLLLPRSIAIADTDPVLTNIVKTARKHGIAMAHPLVLCAIAALFGNEDAFGVLKSRTAQTSSFADASYNVIMDIAKLKQIIYMRHLDRYGNRYRLLTMDKCLDRFTRLFHVRATSSVLTQTTDYFSTTIDIDVFLNNLPSLRRLNKKKVALRSVIAEG